MATMAAVSASKQHPRPIKKARKAKKSVRFATICQVAIFQEPFGDSEKTWYGTQEYKDFRIICKEDLIAFATSRKVGTFDAIQHCVRGLESYFPPTQKRASEERKRNRLLAVLGQQDLQRLVGASDPESIAFLSGMLSKTSCERAAELGRRDAMVWTEP